MSIDRTVITAILTKKVRTVKELRDVFMTRFNRYDDDMNGSNDEPLDNEFYTLAEYRVKGYKSNFEGMAHEVTDKYDLDSELTEEVVKKSFNEFIHLWLDIDHHYWLEKMKVSYDKDTQKVRATVVLILTV
jgi:hypothetical protein